ncbi:glycoside hydrolase 5 family protein [Sphingomonas sp. Leaf25]|uniref:glycoside hydrolase 5 family protein n=1 Tax=Sphingomonas sp. Leaf25 TaxID=1735692 RepID=UPI0009EC53A1|nr:cellulase family glycosylhydrolase [Sphingomonas sp. Leaf25]
MVDRRSVLAGGLVLAGCAATGQTPPGTTAARPFIRRDGMRLIQGDRPYRFAGANLWYAAWLGADAPYGDRARLSRELDRLKAAGVTNLRIMASAEEGPLNNSIKPGFRTANADYNETMLAGLDWAMAEIARRGMTAVLCLTNFWEWSGGLMTYLSYVGEPWIDMGDPKHPWPEFPNSNSRFYGNARAVALYHAYVRAVVTRTNRVTGKPYRDDPAVMAWQLCNEPRPAGDLAHAKLPDFYGWVDGTARLIKSLDANHLVSTGSEGLKGSLEQTDIVRTEHAFDSIDYLTVHVWPNNWTWVDQKDLPGTYARGETLVEDYVRKHIAIARDLNKPMVIEEFGYPRDGGSNDPKASIVYKDRFYQLLHRLALADAQSGGPTAGTNFWAWNGEARTKNADWRFHPGDLQYMGDPPHEPQGWYGVFDTDASTLALVAAQARAMQAIG